MGNIKRQHSASFKTKVAVEMIKEIENQSTICSRYSVHPTLGRRWKDEALAAIENQFSERGRVSEAKAKDELIEELYKQIGQLKVELDWLKKKFGSVQ